MNESLSTCVNARKRFTISKRDQRPLVRTLCHFIVEGAEKFIFAPTPVPLAGAPRELKLSVKKNF